MPLTNQSGRRMGMIWQFPMHCSHAPATQGWRRIIHGLGSRISNIKKFALCLQCPVWRSTNCVVWPPIQSWAMLVPFIVALNPFPTSAERWTLNWWTERAPPETYPHTITTVIAVGNSCTISSGLVFYDARLTSCVLIFMPHSLIPCPIPPGCVSIFVSSLFRYVR